MVACRGTDRHRTIPSRPGTERYPWRKTVIVGREDGKVHEVGPIEEWVRLPKLRQIRATGPAKISLTMFGYRNDPMHPMDQKGLQDASMSASNSHATSDAVPGADARSPFAGEPIAAAQFPDAPMCESLQVPAENQHASGIDVAWAPKIIPKSGPKFLGLDKELQRDPNLK